jgi:hypothetical protein
LSVQDAQLARLVSYVFQTVGRRRISEDDWVRVLSHERQWAPPSRARKLVAAARTLGLVRNAGERDYELGLEAEGLPLPIDYRPDLEAIEAATGSPSTASPATLPLFRRIVRTVAQRLSQSEPEVIGRVNATQRAFGGLLTAEVAALHYGALQGVDVSAFYQEALATLKG